MTILLALLLVFAPPPQPSGSIALNESGPYQHGDVITFTTTVQHFPKDGRNYLSPWVQVICRQDGYLIYGASGRPYEAITLGLPSPSQWDVLGGTIQCVAELGYFTLRDSQWHMVATTPEFEVTRP